MTASDFHYQNFIRHLAQITELIAGAEAERVASKPCCAPEPAERDQEKTRTMLEASHGRTRREVSPRV